MDIQFLTSPVWDKELSEAVEVLNDLEKMLGIDDITEDTLTEFCWLNHNDIWGYCCHADVSNTDCENFIYFHPKCLKDVPFKYNYNNKEYRLSALTFVNAPMETHMSNIDREREEYLCPVCWKDVRKIILSQSCEECGMSDPDMNPDFQEAFADVLRINDYVADQDDPNNPLLQVD